MSDVDMSDCKIQNAPPVGRKWWVEREEGKVDREVKKRERQRERESQCMNEVDEWMSG